MKSTTFLEIEKKINVLYDNNQNKSNYEKKDIKTFDSTILNQGRKDNLTFNTSLHNTTNYLCSEFS